MKIIKSINKIRQKIGMVKRKGRTVGFVPTMGALHEGHVSLLRASRKDNDVTVLSVFVNPAQFGPAEDFKKYPRPFKNDILLAKKEKVDIIFYPSVDDMYTSGNSSFIDVGQVSQDLCGRFRPGHFRGVATVVAKLLNIVGPDRLYLGEKDAQQVVVLKKLIDDLNFSVRIKTCSTVREHDGLAMSSRNKYLTSRERNEASVLYEALKKAKLKAQKKAHRAGEITRFIEQEIKRNTSAKVQYIECVEASTLKPLKMVKGPVMIALAVFFGKTRLIDNITFRV